jgi:hypothetical protein
LPVLLRGELPVLFGWAHLLGVLNGSRRTGSRLAGIIVKAVKLLLFARRKKFSRAMKKGNEVTMYIVKNILIGERPPFLNKV